MTHSRIHIGTSGWHYSHWVGPFYPAGTSSEEFLDFYTGLFRTVEINNTFYQLPARETLDAWREGTPKDFLFACKASRFITHMKKLKEPKQSVARFFRTIEALREKLGPILFQLPPRWRLDVARLRAFLKALPRDHRYAFEFRDESWFTQDTLNILAEYGAAFCIYDLAGRQSPEAVTADIVYVRLHGPGKAYQGHYERRVLQRWARRCLAWSEEGKEIYVYFDNDEKGYAAQDALTLQRTVENGSVRRVPCGHDWCLNCYGNRESSGSAWFR